MSKDAPTFELTGQAALEPMLAPLEMVTFAAPDCEVSSELIAIDSE